MIRFLTDENFNEIEGKSGICRFRKSAWVTSASFADLLD
jgi:hypothetical protein